MGLIKQGVRLIYGSIAHPQTQGKVERFHRTMKQEMKHRGVPQTVEGMATALSHFRQIYNEIRPHEALAQRPPADAYVPATQSRPLPRFIKPLNYASADHTRRVTCQGSFKWFGRPLFLSEALEAQTVGLYRQDQEDVYEVRFGDLKLGLLFDTPAKPVFVRV